MCATGAVDIWLMYVTIKMMIKRLHFHLVQSSCRFIPFNYYLGHIYKWRRFWWWTRVSHFVRILSKVPIMKVIRSIAEHYNWVLPFLLNKKKTKTRVSIICFKTPNWSILERIRVFCFIGLFFLKYFQIFAWIFFGFFELQFRSDFFVRLEYFRSIVCFVNILLIKYVLVWR